MTNKLSSLDIPRITLAVIFIGMLIAASFWILRPFVLSTIWATMIVVATWPFMLWVQKRLWDKRGLAAAVMTVGLLMVFVVPFALAVATIVENADEIAAWAKSIGMLTLPPPPDWIKNLPLVGPRLAAAWQETASIGGEGLRAHLAPHAGAIVKWFATQAGNVGMMFVYFLLTIVISAILYFGGEAAAGAVRLFARRLAGQRGEDAAVLAAKTIRGVALGVILTAFAQSVLGGIGLAIAGVPGATLLIAVMFIFGVAQLGSTLVLVPAVVWMYWKGDPWWGTFLLVWTIVVSSLDNFLRPVLIRKGADLPLLLIFAGVIGGLSAFGIIGIFIGPVVLAVSYKLLEAWIQTGEDGSAPTSPNNS